MIGSRKVVKLVINLEAVVGKDIDKISFVGELSPLT